MSTSLAVLPKRTEAQATADWLSNYLSEQTKRAYRGDISAFVEWLQLHGITSLRGVTRRDVTDYRDELLASGFAPATVARKLSCLRKLMETGYADGWLETNPVKFVRAPRVSDVSPRHALDTPVVRALLAQPDRTTLLGARDYAILCLLLYLGVRRSEVAGLRIGSLGQERAHHTLRVVGKGEKVRLLPVPPLVLDAITTYLQRSGRMDAADDEALFQPTMNRAHGGVTAKALHSDSIWRIVTRYAKRAGISDIDVHTLRHTALTAALDGGASLRRVQAMAGHSDPKTTARYDSRRGDLDDSAVYRVSY